MSSSKETHALASFVHGALAAGHLLGCVYNLRKRNWYNLAVHAYAMGFSINATVHHSKECRPKSEAKVPNGQ